MKAICIRWTHLKPHKSNRSTFGFGKRLFCLVPIHYFFYKDGHLVTFPIQK